MGENEDVRRLLQHAIGEEPPVPFSIDEVILSGRKASSRRRARRIAAAAGLAVAMAASGALALPLLTLQDTLTPVDEGPSYADSSPSASTVVDPVAEECGGPADVRPPTDPLASGTAVGPYYVPQCGAVLVKHLLRGTQGTRARACYEDNEGVLTGECEEWVLVTDEWRAVARAQPAGRRLQLQVRTTGNSPRLLAWP